MNPEEINARRNSILRIVAIVSLISLSLYIVGQLVAVFQTRYQLVSPLIPESSIWEINKQFVFTALVSAIVNVIGLVLYFFKQYLLAIILVVLTLIVNRFIYI